MRLERGVQLAYCTNIHRGETWAETFDALQRYTLAVREKVCPNNPYAIGLRLSDRASRELSDGTRLRDFRRWLDERECYVFTINGFPYGQFHGTRVKEQVYVPDWTQRERLDYTKRLFDLLAELMPQDMEGSVSTVPGSFKEFITRPEQERRMRDHLWECVDHVEAVSRRSGRTLHLGLEPEPLGYLETSAETVEFFEAMRQDRTGDDRLATHLGVNYDTCHLAVEFEEPEDVLRSFREHGIKVSKIHLSSALSVRPTPEVRARLREFADEVYLHQVVARSAEGKLARYRDLDAALAEPAAGQTAETEWRIHFHIPLHSPATSWFENTSAHIPRVLETLSQHRDTCQHLEMETYTWEVLPPALKNRSVVEQLTSEYEWCLQRLAEHGFAQAGVKTGEVR